jgi:hypothetical protein
MSSCTFVHTVLENIADLVHTVLDMAVDRHRAKVLVDVDHFRDHMAVERLRARVLVDIDHCHENTVSRHQAREDVYLFEEWLAAAVYDIQADTFQQFLYVKQAYFD